MKKNIRFFIFFYIIIINLIEKYYLTMIIKLWEKHLFKKQNQYLLLIITLLIKQINI